MTLHCLSKALASPGGELEQAVRLLRSDAQAVVIATDLSTQQQLRERLDGEPALLQRCLSVAQSSDPSSIHAGAVGSRRSRSRSALPGSSVEPIAVDPATRALFDLARRVASTSVSVLVTGESGTGKEVLARLLHRESPRCDGPFTAINCAAIPDTMLEAMLFGYEKGAFTGAAGARAGKFELADGGTLLLDEVTEMPLALQAKLLRVLQEREVERLGAVAPKPVDVRVVATSNRDLKQAVADGDFREDLYFRLCVFPLRMPALSERPLDIDALAQAFVERYAEGSVTPELSLEALDRLRCHTWPGNVRELENAIQRALVLNPNGPITGDDLLLEIPAEASSDAQRDLGSERARAEQQLIIDALRRCDGNRRATAEALGISERTLRHKLKQHRDRGVDLLADSAGSRSGTVSHDSEALRYV